MWKPAKGYCHDVLEIQGNSRLYCVILFSCLNTGGGCSFSCHLLWFVILNNTDLATRGLRPCRPSEYLSDVWSTPQVPWHPKSSWLTTGFHTHKQLCLDKNPLVIKLNLNPPCCTNISDTSGPRNCRNCAKYIFQLHKWKASPQKIRAGCIFQQLVQHFFFFFF